MYVRGNKLVFSFSRKEINFPPFLSSVVVFDEKRKKSNREVTFRSKEICLKSSFYIKIIKKKIVIFFLLLVYVEEPLKQFFVQIFNLCFYN